MKQKYIVNKFFAILLFTTAFLIGCSKEERIELDCILTAVVDNYWENTPQNFNDTIYPRRILLVYKIRNHLSERIFLPIRLSLNDREFCSQFHVKIGDEPADDVINLMTRMKEDDRELSPGQTTWLYIHINGQELEKYGLKSTDNLKKILSQISIEYESCKNDSIYSAFPMAQLNILRAPQMEYHYRTDAFNNSMCMVVPFNKMKDVD